MTYLGPKIYGNFKPEKNPNAPKKVRAAAKRPGMDPEYLVLIRTLPSCIDGAGPCEAHHLKVKEERGVGMRSTDRWAVPITRGQHHEVEKRGSKAERAWFRSQGIANCYALATALWKAPRDRDVMIAIMEAHRWTA